MIPAGTGIGFTVSMRDAGLPSPQSVLWPRTVSIPDMAVESKVMVTEFVPNPAVMTAPTGNDH